MKMNNFRSNNYGTSYYDQPKMGFSSVSKNYNYSARSTDKINIDGAGDEHNFGEIEFMLESERKKFK